MSKKRCISPPRNENKEEITVMSSFPSKKLDLCDPSNRFWKPEPQKSASVSRLSNNLVVSSLSQMDLSDLDLETLAPYIPMDGEDFQLNPIIPESEPLEGVPAGSVGGTSNLSHTHQSFSNIASLFQPLSSPPRTPGHYQHQPSAAPWGAKEKRGSGPGAVDPGEGLRMMAHMQNPPYKAPANTPLSSMGGRQNLQWPPDPLLTYQPPAQTTKSYLMDPLLAEERLSCQQNQPHFMQKHR